MAMFTHKISKYTSRNRKKRTFSKRHDQITASFANHKPPNISLKKKSEPEVNTLQTSISDDLTDIKEQPDTPLTGTEAETQAEIDEINRIIDQASDKLHSLEANKSDYQKDNLAPVLVDQPSQFNGVSDDEHWQILDSELENERRKSAKLLNEINIIKQDFEQEKTRLDQHIRDLKRELHRTQPIDNHNFFSISKELKEAVSLMDKIIVSDNKNEKGDIPLENSMLKQVTVNPVSSDIPNTKQNSQNLSAPMKTNEPQEIKPETQKTGKNVEVKEDSKKPAKRKKILITGGIVILIMIISSTLISGQFRKPKVNEELVQEYMQKNGQVQGTTDQANGISNTQTSNNQIQGSGTDNSQKDIPIGQTVWAPFNEPMFGITLEYPQNTVKLNRSESNVTFVRKDGYIFRIQKIDTGLNLDDYWKQIKPTNMNYSVEEETFKGNKALFLQLQEITKYPGDRYLVKVGEAIFDIWYATPSQIFNKDDIERAKRMLDTLTFVKH